MAYNANLYNPYGQPQPYSWSQPVQPVNGLTKVESFEEAQTYALPPNSVSPPLMLSSENVFFVKTTDGVGGFTMSAFRFEPIDLPGSKTDYVTKEDFNEFMEKVMEAINGQHPVSE